MPKKGGIRKEEICEDFCFNCKDGGYLIICDYKNCLKAYHPECVGKDDAFMKSGKKWNCRWHSCFICQKASKFYCFCCPQAVCGRCLFDAEFVLIGGNKGFCQQCLSLALLIENGSNVDSNGVPVDFKDINTYECLFLSYWENIKKKEGLSGKCVHSADDLLKKGENYRGDLYSLETGKIEENIGESEGDSHLLVSDYDDLEDVKECKSVKKRSASKRRSRVRNRKAKSKEFVGWGSKSLLEFLAFVGKDTTKQLSQYDITSIITDYCKENKLFDPEKKKRILCDEKLQSLFGRKCLLKNSLSKLLHAHFAENFEQSTDDGLWSSSEDTDDKCKRQRISGSARENQKTKAHMDVPKSCFASVSAENIKLIYLKKSLVEELLKQPESFDSKVVGSFVRVKCNPNDYLQRNSHQLLQVKGVKLSSNGHMSAETSLQFFNSPEESPICKLSDENFTEEECEDLCQRIKDGLLKKPTVTFAKNSLPLEVELDQKARSLHEDITKHLLNDPIEQSRLLNDLPQVIAELEPDAQDLAKDGPNSSDESLSWDWESSPQTPKTDMGSGIFSCQTETRDEHIHSKGSVSKELPQQSHSPEVGNDILEGESHDAVLEVNRSCKELFPEVVKEKCPAFTSEGQTNLNILEQSKIQSASKVEVIQLSDNEQLSKADRLAEDLDASGTRDKRKQPKGSVSKENRRSSKVEIVELSDDDERACKTETGHETHENASSSLWYFMSAHGSRGGPYRLSSLKTCFDKMDKDFKLMVWKEGQSIEDAILLEDAIRQNFRDT
ncbi:Zinc finger CCCH domain-containing protein 44 [Morus notabilis]|uniref:Zinc finger CCCH domain-containing protein 44 n=1 Tax=Morus notabilis TaxID=981085 RepID=W9SKR1_9ROSA|nr:Zinc finger CCCH domain-containing protein 44 [Morus notabilis]